MEEDCGRGSRDEGLSRGRRQRARPGKNLLMGQVEGKVQWGSRLCRRLVRGKGRTSVEGLARAPCQGQ